MKKTGFVLLFSMVAIPAFAQSLGLPFEGRWFVMQGGDTPNVNEHMRLGAQAYGIDFTRVGGPSGRQLTRVPQPTRVEDFFGWAEVVLSPSDGSVVSAVDAFPDNPLGVKDGANALGNHVDVELAGQSFKGVTWPLIRGLFVSNTIVPR